MNFIWTGCPASGLHFGKKPECKLDGGPSDSHLQMKMWTGWPSSGLQFFFQNINRMGCHPFHIFIWKCESDGPPSVYNFFFWKKTEGHFGHFYRNNFDIFKTYGGAGRGYGVQKESVFIAISTPLAYFQHLKPSPWNLHPTHILWAQLSFQHQHSILSFIYPFGFQSYPFFTQMLHVHIFNIVNGIRSKICWYNQVKTYL